jgi:putative inorganic carbon (HCO3(-)) transporter
LLPDVDALVTLDLQNQSRLKTFFQLWNALRNKYFDVVISSGSNPLIPILLWLSGIKIRVGFGTGKISQKLLTVEGYLAPKRQRIGYAADMYFTLASSFLSWLFRERYTPMHPVLPHLKTPPPEDIAWAQEKLQTPQTGKKILLHPGVSQISIQKNILKSWAPEAWAELIQRLGETGCQVFLAGGPDDKQAIEGIRRALPTDLPFFHDLYGQTKNLRQLAALICESDLLIGVDSSPMHIAVGYQTPTIALFGPTDEKKLLPNIPRFRAVSVSDLSCRPCLWDVRDESCERPVCLDIPVESVIRAVQEVLNANYAVQ